LSLEGKMAPKSPAKCCTSQALRSRPSSMSKTISEMSGYLEEMSSELVSLMDFDMMEMYRYLTDLGNTIAHIDPEEQIPANFVPGCTSNVYVSAHLEDGSLVFTGSSEAHIVRGYLTILINALSGLSPQDFLDHSRSFIEKFAEDTRIKAALTPSRANAFGNIYKLMEQKVQELSRI